MVVALPRIRVGDPRCHESLSVFPLFSEAGEGVEYRLADVALADQSLVVEEVSEGGSVPELLVENKGDARILFLEGEELVGAKQNRILNTSVLVAAHTRLKIPVSCVEQGRWGYRSRRFGSSGSHSPSKLRRSLRSSVSRSVKEKRGHRSDQGEVWKEVASLQASHGVRSDTSAMSDVFRSYEERIQAFKENLQYVPGASGMAVAIGPRVTCVDLFDKPSTCEAVWNRLLSGLVFDALEARETEHKPTVEDVQQFLEAAGKLAWEAAEAVGEGSEFRAESEAGDHGSALSFQDVVVHGSVIAADLPSEHAG